MLEQGDTPPDFTLQGIDGDGNEVEVRLSDLTDRPVVLYFYPKDDTSGCTTQACGIRDAWPDFGRTGAHVFGISPDGLDDHRKFSSKYDLPFTLLSDPGHAVLEDYGVWKKKNMYGREYMGVERSTFVIADGRVVEAWRRVRPKEHAARVLDVLAGLG